MNIRKKLAAGAATVALAVAVGILGAAPAQAAERWLGHVECGTLREIHTVAHASGRVIHEIYGARQWGQMWDDTNRIDAGYSSSPMTWDEHHWLYKTMKSGRVFGSRVDSASPRCV